MVPIQGSNPQLDTGVNAAQASATYTVGQGDSLSAIAAREGTTVDALMAANPQISNPDMIYVDDTLVLPGALQQTGGATGEGTAAADLSLSQDGVDLIKSFEGLRLNSYQDSGGVWTIGYGHTSGVGPGQTITQAQADSFLRQDVQWAENAVRDNVDVPLTQNQFDALVSFTFNVGAGAFAGSTLLRNLNAGDYAGAQEQFGRWVNADGQRLEGLVRRRGDEAALFGSEGPSGTDTPTEPDSPDAPSTNAYTVRAGDTLSGIAQTNGVSVDALIAANPQISNPNLIMPGQVINLPGDAPAPTSTYTVKPGDTLSGIAMATGVPMNELVAMNPQIGNVNLIYPGQELTVSGSATVDSPPATPTPAPVDGVAPTYEPYTVYSTGDRPAFAVSDASELQAHHDYETRNRDGQILEVRDVVLHRPGESQSAQAIPSPVTGEVIQAGPNGNAGNSVVLRSESGQLVYIFHMSAVDVSVGQQVTYGQDLGNQGSTGHSTGPHVHIEAPDSVIESWVDDLLDGTFDGIDSL
ncbi:MAG: LysM peptidoglycan-binding domain-containing protein [Gammaproteobacteria bacterium]